MNMCNQHYLYTIERIEGDVSGAEVGMEIVEHKNLGGVATIPVKNSVGDPIGTIYARYQRTLPVNGFGLPDQTPENDILEDAEPPFPTFQKVGNGSGKSAKVESPPNPNEGVFS